MSKRQRNDASSFNASDLLHRFPDKCEDLFPAIAGGGGGLQNDGFSGTEFLHGFLKKVDVFLHYLGFHLVGFGKDEGEGDFAFDEPADELQVELLGRVACVDEDKGAAEVFAFEKVFGDEFIELVPHRFRDLGVAVSGQVNEAPGVVDFEEVDFAGPAGGLGDAGESILVGEKIDQGGFADIGPPDEGKLRKLGGRAAVELGGALDEFGGLDSHGGGLI